MTLLELLKLMRKHLTLMIVLPAVCAIAAAGYCWLVMPDTYTAKSSMYVLTSQLRDTAAESGTNGSSASSAMSGDFNISSTISNDVAALFKTDRIESDTAKALGMKDLKGYEIAVEQNEETRLLTVSVTGTDAEGVAKVCNQMVIATDDLAQESMDVQSINVIDQAQVPEEPSGPNRLMYLAVAILAGLFLAVAIIVVLDMLDTRVRDEEEMEELLGLPIIGRIPYVKGLDEHE